MEKGINTCMRKNRKVRYTSGQGGDVMYRIGICDDDIKFGCQIEEYLKEYASNEHIEIETEVFISGEEYLSFLKMESKLDLLFLDIEFGKRIDGIVVGNIMRSDSANEATQIVYVSAKESYAMRLFKTRPMDFLVKPITREAINRIMKEYIRIFSCKKNFFEYHVGKTECRIATNEIMYFQCNGKKIRIVTSKKEEKEFYGKMADVEKQLDSKSFVAVHKSYILNINFVYEFYPDRVVMVTNEIIPISQSFRKKVKQRILEVNIERR